MLLRLAARLGARRRELQLWPRAWRSTLPLADFPGRIHVMQSGAEADALIAHLAWDQPGLVLGFDTESVPSTGRLAILQFASGNDALVLRVLGRAALSPAVEHLLVRPDKRLATFGAAGDLAQVHRALPGVAISGVLGLEHAAAALGLARLRLRDLAAAVLRCDVSKAQRQSDWGAWPLHARQLAYAATDAWVCWRLAYVLQATQPTLWAESVESRLCATLGTAVQAPQVFARRLAALAPDASAASVMAVLGEAARYYGLAASTHGGAAGGSPATVTIGPVRAVSSAGLREALSQALAQLASGAHAAALLAGRADVLQAKRRLRVPRTPVSLGDVLRCDPRELWREDGEDASRDLVGLLYVFCDAFRLALPRVTLASLPAGGFSANLALPVEAGGAVAEGVGRSHREAKRAAARVLLRRLWLDWERLRPGLLVRRRAAAPVSRERGD